MSDKHNCCPDEVPVEMVVKELRTTPFYRTCRKCGLTMSPGSVVMVFEVKEDGFSTVIGYEHPTACPGELMKKRPSLSVHHHI